MTIPTTTPRVHGQLSQRECAAVAAADTRRWWRLRVAALTVASPIEAVEELLQLGWSPDVWVGDEDAIIIAVTAVDCVGAAGGSHRAWLARSIAKLANHRLREARAQWEIGRNELFGWAALADIGVDPLRSRRWLRQALGRERRITARLNSAAEVRQAAHRLEREADRLLLEEVAA